MNPAIEAFRAAAALMVLLHHYSYSLGPDAAARLGWVHFFHNGVDLFFVITGYLFAPHLLGAARITAVPFLVRRAFRLYPLYLVSLGMGAVTLWGDPALAVQLVRHLLFVQTLPMFPAADAGYFSLVYWTLPVEVSFYALVAVMLAWPSGGSRSGWRTALLGLAGLAGFALFEQTGGPVGSPDWLQWHAQFPGLLLEFWFGVLLHQAQPLVRRRGSAAWLMFAAGLALMAALMIIYPTVAVGARAPRPFGAFNLLSALGYALLLGAALEWTRTGHAEHARLRSLAVAGGGVSYGVYLFHGFPLAWVHALPADQPGPMRLAGAALLTLAMATVLHVGMEQPLRALGRRLTPAQPVPRAPPARAT
jgi:exopolysaccharide production protein ExoZ